MPDIVLTTLNAKYIHASLGLRYLFANLGPLQPRAQLLEFDINQRPGDIAMQILAREPAIVGLGVYIWNVAAAGEVAAILKRVRPELTLVLGGPEISHETESHPIFPWADYVILGEGDLAFAGLCQQVLDGRPPATKILRPGLPDLARVRLPYDLYSEPDLQHRLVYVEASRGCPFTCDFCLSALDEKTRLFPQDEFMAAMERLLKRGLLQFKFVDRTFNLRLEVAARILDFFLANLRPGLFLHFEMVPDRLPEPLKERLRQFPAGSLQLEIGVQTFTEEVAQRIHRRQNNAAIEENLRFLRRETGAHLHTDLIFGLPGETWESFAASFDRLVSLHPQEIQVGMLKRLRGAPISQHDQTWEMVYNPFPPYEILKTKTLSAAQLQQLRRFARAFDLVANSGNFVESTPLLWRDGGSPFHAFLAWSEWLNQQVPTTQGVALNRLMELFFRYLTEQTGRQPAEIVPALWRDYQRGGRNDKPLFMRDFLPVEAAAVRRRNDAPLIKRQNRHTGAETGPQP